MPANNSTHSPEELARLGTEIFNRDVRPKLQPADDGKFVAIDVDSAEFEIDADDYSAVTRLRNRCPNAEVWLKRAGQPTAYQMRRCGWDDQIEADIAAGKLDKAGQKADADFDAGRCTPL